MNNLRADYESRNPGRYGVWQRANRETARQKKTRYRAVHPEKRKDEARSYYDRNQALISQKKKQRRTTDETFREKDRQYRAKNRDVLKAKRKDYVKQNRLMFYAYSAFRRALERKATPSWADAEKVKAVYLQAMELTKQTGVKHHVDHIVPLKGKKVCGLHVHNNLRAIPWVDNLKKGARHDDN